MMMMMMTMMLKTHLPLGRTYVRSACPAGRVGKLSGRLRAMCRER